MQKRLAVDERANNTEPREWAGIARCRGNTTAQGGQEAGAGGAATAATTRCKAG